MNYLQIINHDSFVTCKISFEQIDVICDVNNRFIHHCIVIMVVSKLVIYYYHYFASYFCMWSKVKTMSRIVSKTLYGKNQRNLMDTINICTNVSAGGGTNMAILINHMIELK